MTSNKKMKKNILKYILLFLTGMAFGSIIIVFISFIYGQHRQTTYACVFCGTYLEIDEWYFYTRGNIIPSQCSKWIKKASPIEHVEENGIFPKGSEPDEHIWCMLEGKEKGWFKEYTYYDHYNIVLPHLIHQQIDLIGEEKALKILNEFHSMKKDKKDRLEIIKRLEEMGLKYPSREQLGL
jgi:hypothetical protein